MGVARGDLDATLSAWLPATHGAYWEQVTGKVTDLGVNFPDAKIGLVVPASLPENSIADLEAHKADFNGRIVGIDAGAGVMKKADDAIKAYNLGLTLMPSSGSAMTAELARQMHADKPVVVTGGRRTGCLPNGNSNFWMIPRRYLAALSTLTT